MFWKKRIYLDTAAGVAGNPSSPHEEGRRAKAVLEDSRTAIARLVEVQSDDVMFTSGATESNALAILGYVRALRAKGKNDIHVLYLPSSHASIVENVKLLEAEGVRIEALPIREYRVDTDALALMLTSETVLVTMDAVCGETGVVWNTREVAEVLKNTSVVLHVDASQAPATEKITRDHFGADTLTFDGSKVGPMRGPSHYPQCGGRGIGVLIAHRTLPMLPLYKGGGQERALRPGSESPELAQSFARALASAVQGRETFVASASGNRTRLLERITKDIPNVSIQQGAKQAPHILNLSLPGRDTDYLVALLDEAGFAVSTRSACETDSEEGSRAVYALTGDSEKARSTLRISWNRDTRPSELLRFSEELAETVAFIDRGTQR